MAQAAGRQLSLRKPRFNPKSVRVGFVVDKMVLGFPPSTSAFPRQYHFAGVHAHLFIYPFIDLSPTLYYLNNCQHNYITH
jgi:hypothetical protein